MNERCLECEAKAVEESRFCRSCGRALRAGAAGGPATSASMLDTFYAELDGESPDRPVAPGAADGATPTEPEDPVLATFFGELDAVAGMPPGEEAQETSPRISSFFVDALNQELDEALSAASSSRASPPSTTEASEAVEAAPSVSASSDPPAVADNAPEPPAGLPQPWWAPRPTEPASVRWQPHAPPLPPQRTTGSHDRTGIFSPRFRSPRSGPPNPKAPKVVGPTVRPDPSPRRPVIGLLALLTALTASSLFAQADQLWTLLQHVAGPSGVGLTAHVPGSSEDAPSAQPSVPALGPPPNEQAVTPVSAAAGGPTTPHQARSADSHTRSPKTSPGSTRRAPAQPTARRQRPPASATARTQSASAPALASTAAAAVAASPEASSDTAATLADAEPAESTPPVPSTDNDAARSVSRSTVYELGQVDIRPQVTHRVEAPYPGTRRAGAEDVVILRVLVSAGGTPADVRVLRKSKIDPAFDAAALDALRRWRFTPARKGDQPVDCWLNVGVPIRQPSSAQGSQ